jgi:uncharacterized protein (TIGR03545 family)
MRRHLKVFRWRAVGPLLLFGLLLVVLYLIFAERIARSETESTLSETLGTEVDLASFRIREKDAAVDLGGLQIADPRNPKRNLIEAGTITVDLDPVPLAEKKIVIDELRLSGLRFLTERKNPARPADPDSPAGKLLRETEQWARDKFNFPKLAIGRIDSAKSLVLNPEQLGSVKAVRALVGAADSTRAAFDQRLAALQLKPLVDSSTALATRLAQSDPRQLGLAGAKSAITDVGQAIDRIKQARTNLADLETTAKASFGVLQQGLRDVEAARQHDYEFAKGLLQLPSFDAPDIGASLFGSQSTDYFQQALYYAQIIQRYVPPGLQPWNRPGPKRLRMAGTSVEFPKEKSYPRFLLRKGDIDLAAGAGGENQFKAEFGGITSQPELYGHPATLAASGWFAGEHPVGLDLALMSRHFGKAPKDSLVAAAHGVDLPAISLPGLPFAVHPGRANLALAFSLAGDRIAGAWEVSSNQATWTGDSTHLASASLVESTVWRVVSGLSELRVRAELGGTVSSPTLKVSSNLDDAIAARLRGLVGEELAKGEQKARDAVDHLVDQQVTALRGKVGDLQSQALARLPVEKGQLEEVQKQLETQLKRLAGSAAGGLKLPKL